MTLTLYYAPGACSLASHIAAREADIPVELESVSLRNKKTEAGDDFLAINPKGYVPALKLDDGQVLTENAVILPYLADQKPEAGLIPPAGSTDRLHVLEWLSFTGTELHKPFIALFVPNAPEPAKDFAKGLLTPRLKYLNDALGSKTYLTGNRFTVADAYAWVVLSWCDRVGVDLSAYPNIQRFQAEVKSRPAVQQALKEEGLA
ncbi:glutathione transferase GstA [Rhodoligotrophos ferricapiens]|uniref:glutathione transferase GstA n=1 Tax=Rhodoligotrophos ferricapiens TaxID=3069264 RepID=UPI00315DBDFD